MAETLAPIPLGPPRPGKGGQRNDSSVYKPSRGGCALVCCTLWHKNWSSVSLHEGDPPNGDPEHRYLSQPQFLKWYEQGVSPYDSSDWAVRRGLFRFAMPFYALFMVDGTTGWDEQFSLSSQDCQIEISLVEWSAHHPVGVECLHVGDDSITGGSFTVAALRWCKTLECLTGHILREGRDAAYKRLNITANWSRQEFYPSIIFIVVIIIYI